MATEKRTRTGCATCRKRRIKCDEGKPTCNRCRTANFVCDGYAPPQRARVHGSTSPKNSPSPPREEPGEESEKQICEMSWRHKDWRQEQLPIYHHFVTTTVQRLFRDDHVSFWRDQVAQMSYGVDFVHEALLAVGAVHRASLLGCSEESAREAARIKVLGLHCYGKTLRMLPKHLGKDTPEEIFAVLVVLMLLAYFECFMENSKGAFRHLWAAIQLLRRSEQLLSKAEIANMVPVYDVMLRLDLHAQKLVPFARSAFLECSDLAIMESPFWNRPSLDFPGVGEPDSIAAEGYRLTQLVSAHNKLSRVLWGCWCPIDERPTRHELMGFHAEMMLWKANSPATFASCSGLDILDAVDTMAVDSLPFPPPACHFLSDEVALNIMMYNAYLGCAWAMISTTDDIPAIREQDVYRLVYQQICITAGLLERRNANSGSILTYKACDSICTGVSLFMYNAARRCFSLEWQQWTIMALRSIGREGLSNGYTSANALDIMCQLESTRRSGDIWQLNDYGLSSSLGPIRDRIFPLLMPRGDDGQNLAFFLQYNGDYSEFEGVERAVQVVAKATWSENAGGEMSDLKLDVYDSAISGQLELSERPQGLDLFYDWRKLVEEGWHGYLKTDIKDEFASRTGLAKM